jgi:hypothetical protein
MMRDNVAYLVEWELIHTDNYSGMVLHHGEGKNLITKDGRQEALELLFGLGSAFTALCAGACSASALVTDSRLNYEHILNATRKALTVTSVSDDEYVDPDSGVTFYKKITASASYDGSTDSNANQPFQEFGVNTLMALPGTPTSTSGTLFNHYVHSVAIVLTGPPTPTTLTVNIVIRA